MNIDNLIKLNLELEGLLRVLATRDSAEAKQLLDSKYAEFKNAFEQTFAEPSQIEVQSEEVSAEDTQLPEPATEPIPVEEPVLIPESEIEPEPEPEISIPEPQHNEPQHTVAVSIPEPDYTAADEIIAARQNEMRVDEMLTRREARDLRKAFTLNDKFRFRRELFANNDAKFADTLNLLSAMQNLDEAIEYMRDDMGWDMDSDDVKDFVNIVNNHFASV